MSKKLIYDFDNFDEDFYFKLNLKNGTCFKFMDCIIKYNGIQDQTLIIEFDNSSHVLSDQEIDKKIIVTSQVLSFVFSAPIFQKESSPTNLSSSVYTTNKFMPQCNQKKLQIVENSVKKYKITQNFFLNCLDLLVTANDNNFNLRYEDAFFYYFKVIERISKKYFSIYVQRNQTKTRVKQNKSMLKKYMQTFSKDNLGLSLTDNMLNTKIDSLYSKIKQDFWGSTFSKISLFILQYKINFDINIVDRLVKCRNKLAHGDYIENIENELRLLWKCESLSNECFSKYFFHESYYDIHLPSQRWFGKTDVWS